MEIGKMLTALGFGDQEDVQHIIKSVGKRTIEKLAEKMLSGLPFTNTEVWRHSYGIGTQCKNIDGIAHTLGIPKSRVYTAKKETRKMLLHASRISILTDRIRHATSR